MTKTKHVLITLTALLLAVGCMWAHDATHLQAFRYLMPVFAGIFGAMIVNGIFYWKEM